MNGNLKVFQNCWPGVVHSEDTAYIVKDYEDSVFSRDHTALPLLLPNSVNQQYQFISTLFRVFINHECFLFIISMPMNACECLFNQEILIKVNSFFCIFHLHTNGIFKTCQAYCCVNEHDCLCPFT